MHTIEKTAAMVKREISAGQGTKNKYRHELKYPVTAAQIVLLENRLRHMIPVDPHAGEAGMYTIRSLYFDDYYDRCLQENEAGTDPREKFRIRIYNHNTERIMLECKRKERGKTQKTACPLTLEQAQVLMQGNVIPDIGNQPPLLRKLTAEMLRNRMRPVVIVEYERIPYVYRNGNVRITFDRNIASSRDVTQFLEESIEKRPVMPMAQHLLEVKYDEYLPDFIYRGLQLENLRQTAFSKYYMCRKYTR